MAPMAPTAVNPPGTQGLADNAHHVMGCQLTQETRVHSALDDVTISTRQPLPVPQQPRAGR